MKNREVKASDYIVRELAARGVRLVFEMSGGMIAHLLDSMGRQRRVRVVSTHHEQAAAFAAEGAARVSGIPGVAMATSGPGATNLLTGIGSCFFDSVPSVFITGQVNTHEQKGRSRVRQSGFQETDIVSLARPLTKLARAIRSAREIPKALDEAFRVACEGRPGPVLLDIPMDVQRTSFAAPRHRQPLGARKSGRAALRLGVEALRAAMESCCRPLVLVGGGVRSAAAVEEFRAFTRQYGIPVVCSLMGRDALSDEDPRHVGMIGTYGNRYANLALAEADVLLVLGSRLDVRQTGSDVEAFRRRKRIFQVDVDASEMNRRVKGCAAIVSELKPFLIEAMARRMRVPDSWLSRIRELKRRFPAADELKGVAGINPNRLMEQISVLAPRDALYVTDVGQHQMWAAQSLQLGPRQRFLTSGGMGAMGFGLPCAMGACLAAGRKTTLVIAGDGGFQTNIQELETVRQHRLPLKILVLNNRSLGMVRQFQESYFEGRFYSTVRGYSCPDFVRVSSAYGIPAWRARRPSGVASALGRLFRTPGPALLEISVSLGANAYPKLAFGGSLRDMEPEID